MIQKWLLIHVSQIINEFTRVGDEYLEFRTMVGHFKNIQ